ncbi:hypothetical protein ACHHYP_20348 [Achlya hypogyna]|uniref:GyrI-like small molecule binding domain-containing protein n=1 Tax=Achlya hypogyna TaxID=1202772 RepID=A0A1V9YPX9_ACHHY|nr:hypothetical protein ACHHYP_20348 [Achlya hypogyna]
MPVENEESYGVCYNYSDGAFDYLCGYATTAERAAIADWRNLDIPAATYAVFPHTGLISEIAATWRALRAWTNDDWERANGAPAFEKYEATFCPNTPGGVAIWLPVQRKV